jgi:hypothetical protein
MAEGKESILDVIVSTAKVVVLLASIIIRIKRSWIEGCHSRRYFDSTKVDSSIYWRPNLTLFPERVRAYLSQRASRGSVTV